MMWQLIRSRIAMTQLNERNMWEDLGDAFLVPPGLGDGLNKQAGATAVLIYCIRYGIRLAKILDKQEDISWLEEKQAMLKEAAVKEFWDERAWNVRKRSGPSGFLGNLESG